MEGADVDPTYPMRECGPFFQNRLVRQSLQKALGRRLNIDFPRFCRYAPILSNAHPFSSSGNEYAAESPTYVLPDDVTTWLSLGRFHKVGATVQ